MVRFAGLSVCPIIGAFRAQGGIRARQGLLLLRLKERLSEWLRGKPLRTRNRVLVGSMLALGMLPIGLSGAIMAYPISQHGAGFLTSADMVPSLVLLLLGVSALFIFCRALGRQTRQLSAIQTQVERIRNGELNAETALVPTDALYGIASGLDDIQSAVTQAVNRQLASEKMKMELITNVSHDLKTPLTSIINYIGLLREEPGLPDTARDYVVIAQQKAERLKTLIQDLFDISKANSGNIELHLTQIGLCDLLRQTLGELEDQTARASIHLKATIPTEQIYVMGDGSKLHRVFENLLVNILKYSMPGTRAYITLEIREQMAWAVFKNISRDEIHYSPEELAERFVRGDASRGTEGSGLGLAIAKSFVELMGGSLELSVDGDLFKASVCMPNCKVGPPPA
ncbi:MAG: sensor histidine kinase [Oscillospiraceae bacterium]